MTTMHEEHTVTRPAAAAESVAGRSARRTSALFKVGYAAAAGYLVVAVFQVALALGAPLGRAAWGGGEAELPSTLRVASAVAAVFWTLAGLFMIGRVRGSRLLPAPVFRWGTWALGGLLVVATVMNVASASPWERFIWGPVALLLAVGTLLTARAPLPAKQRQGQAAATDDELSRPAAEEAERRRAA